MPYILLVTIAASITAQNALKKQYNLHSKKPAPFFFSLMLSAVAMLFFILTSGFRLEFNSGIIVYSIGFALSYGAALIGTMQAIASGPLALTLLFSSYSLLIPTVHGLIALDEKLGIVGIIGLALLILSILLLNLKKDSEKINLKWLVYMLLSFFGNGFCSLVQKLQQLRFDGAYKSEFMIMALLTVAVILFVAAFFAERSDISYTLRRGGYLMVLCGIANGAVNLFVMLLATRMKASIMYPVISAGGIILTWGVSRFMYKEKLTLGQNLALVFGISAVVLMNL